MKTLSARMALLSVFLSIPVLSGCGSLQEEYVKADRLTYEDLAPIVVRGANTLEPEDRDRKLRTLATWDLRLKKAEGK